MDASEKERRRRLRREADRFSYCESAYVIRVGDRWFAGFGGQEDSPITKLKAGLCDAKLISGSAEQKAADYLRRLSERGYKGVLVTLIVPPEAQLSTQGKS